MPKMVVFLLSEHVWAAPVCRFSLCLEPSAAWCAGVVRPRECTVEH